MRLFVIVRVNKMSGLVPEINKRYRNKRVG